MNKRERMEALFNQRETDYVPAGFWFHYPTSYTVEQHLEGHLKLFYETDQDIIKLMDDNFGHFLTKDVHIEKAEDWRNIQLPGRNCEHYKNMEAILRALEYSLGQFSKRNYICILPSSYLYYILSYNSLEWLNIFFPKNKKQ